MRNKFVLFLSTLVVGIFLVAAVPALANACSEEGGQCTGVSDIPEECPSIIDVDGECTEDGEYCYSTYCDGVLIGEVDCKSTFCETNPNIIPGEKHWLQDGSYWFGARR